MAARLGGSQISSLLESVPGIASVLRSPVADAIVNMVRAGAGLGTFDKGLAKELIQYAVRRGLLPATEGDELLAEVEATVGKGRGRRASKDVKKAKKTSAKKPAPRKKAQGTKKKSTGKAVKSAKKTTKTAARSASKSAGRKAKTSKTTSSRRR